MMRSKTKTQEGYLRQFVEYDPLFLATSGFATLSAHLSFDLKACLSLFDNKP
jgi:hypothetical protein